MYPLLAAIAVALIACDDDTTQSIDNKKRQLKDRDNNRADATTLVADAGAQGASVSPADVSDSLDLPEAVGNEVVAPLPLAQIVKKTTQTIEGNLQSLIGTPTDCFALVERAALKRFDVRQIGSQSVFPLPGFGQRNYGATLQTKQGHFAFTYQSTKGFGGQDGTHHGIVLTTKDGNQLDDCSIYKKEQLTRPSAILEHGGKVLVLANNCENTAEGGMVKCLKDGALMAYTVSAQGVLQPKQKYELTNLKNASAMGFRKTSDGTTQLVIAAAGNAKLATLNADTFTNYQVLEGIQDIGTNGNAPTTSAGGVIFTGWNTTIASFDGQTLSPLWTPPGVADSFFIPGVAVSGDSILANFQGPKGISAQVFQPALKANKALEENVPGLSPAAFIAYGKNHFCSGESLSATESVVRTWEAK